MTKNVSSLMLANSVPASLPPVESLANPPVRPTGHGATTLAFENLSFEGGGAKGYAYIGAFQVLEEEGIYPLNVKRVSGTSVGSLFAMLGALGVSSEYMLAKVPADFESLAKDGSGGRLSSFARAARRRGMHPGQKLYEFLGSILEEITGSADITFAQLYERTGRELCIPVTNVTRMITEYCHMKTTPNMAVRVATRMSMSLPVMLQPVDLVHATPQMEQVVSEVYVDGGLLCNNPVHVFDGWWLSRLPGDSFLRRLRPIEHASEHYPRSSRFSPINQRTIGFTLVAAGESDITRGWLVDGATPPRPNTDTANEFTAKEEAQAARNALQKPVQKVLDLLDKYDRDADGDITREELSEAVKTDGISPEELMTVFGSKDVVQIFDKLNVEGRETVNFGEVLAHIEQIGLDITTQLVGFPALPPKNMVEFALNMLEAVTRDLTRANQGLGDRDRTAPINTDYVGTTTFALVQEDLDFLVATGRNNTRAFIDAHRG